MIKAKSRIESIENETRTTDQRAAFNRAQTEQAMIQMGSDADSCKQSGENNCLISP